MHPETWIWVLIPIVAISAFAGLVRRWMILKHTQLEQMSRRAAEDVTPSASQVERLEQRVRVLERIVTNKGLDLADEIEKLRDERVS